MASKHGVLVMVGLMAVTALATIAHAGAEALTTLAGDAAPIVAQAAPAPAAPAGEQTVEALVAAGQPIYAAQCAGCHGDAGRGVVGPALAGNSRLGNNGIVFRQIAQGGSEMPPFSGLLTPEEIIAVGTYVRNSWGNAFGILTR